MENSSSRAITSSTLSKLSRFKSFWKSAVSVTYTKIYWYLIYTWKQNPRLCNTHKDNHKQNVEFPFDYNCNTFAALILSYFLTRLITRSSIGSELAPAEEHRHLKCISTLSSLAKNHLSVDLLKFTWLSIDFFMLCIFEKFADDPSANSKWHELVSLKSMSKSENNIGYFLLFLNQNSA